MGGNTAQSHGRPHPQKSLQKAWIWTQGVNGDQMQSHSPSGTGNAERLIAAGRYFTLSALCQGVWETAGTCY